MRPVNLRVDDGSSDSGKGSASGGKGGSRGTSSGRGGFGSGSGSDGDRESPEDRSSSPAFDPCSDAPALTWIAWIAIGAVLLWIVYMLIRAFLDREAKNAKQSDSEDAADEDPAKSLDALPARVAPAKGGLLDEAPTAV